PTLFRPPKARRSQRIQWTGQKTLADRNRNREPGRMSLRPVDKQPVFLNGHAREGVQTSVRISNVEQQVEPGHDLIGAKEIVAFVPDDWDVGRGGGQDQPRAERDQPGKLPWHESSTARRARLHHGWRCGDGSRISGRRRSKTSNSCARSAGSGTNAYVRCR